MWGSMAKQDPGIQEKEDSLRDTSQKQSLQILPAIDISDGRVARIDSNMMLDQAMQDPYQVADKLLEAGARWIHLVDLDAAIGRGENRDIIEKLVSELPVKIELSGGIQTEESLDFALHTGAERVNLSSVSIGDREWIESAMARYKKCLGVCIDISGTQIKPRGSRNKLGNIWDILVYLEDLECERYVVTEVERDGNITGAPIKLLEIIASKTNTPITASGGIASLEDIRKLRKIVDTGVDSAILGKVLYHQIFTLEQAIEVAGVQE